MSRPPRTDAQVDGVLGLAVNSVLGQGEAADRADLHRRMADPAVAVEVAEVRDLIERFREVGAGVAPSPALKNGLAAAAAARRQSLRRRGLPFAVGSGGPMVLPMYVSWAAAAAVAVVLLSLVVMVERGFVQPARVPAVEQVDQFGSPTAYGSPAPSSGNGRIGDTGIGGGLGESPLVVHHSERGDLVYAEWAEWAVEPGRPQSLPVASSDGPQFHRIMAQWADEQMPSPFAAWIAADNTLAVLRQEFRNRFTPTARQRALRLTGGNPKVDTRVQALADQVAARVDATLTHGDSGASAAAAPVVRDVALALRALLAAGSDTRIGRHRATVQRCSAWMEAQVLDPAMADPDLAVALAALSDVAVCTGAYVPLLAERLEGLALRTLDGSDQSRPPLLHWATSSLALGDAGRVFRLAPAFGVSPSLAYRARMLVAAHVEERLGRAPGDPALLAAQRYGFDDLVDRDLVDQKLRVWRTTFLKPDYVAMHHLAWSQYPVRPGWARFQRELRGLAALETPDGIGEPAALLLCLAMNFAAPGVSQIVAGEG